MADEKMKILELFSRCTHQEQLELMEELFLYLKRDFIRLLPIEVVEKVLSYLPVYSVVSCVRVSLQFFALDSIPVSIPNPQFSLDCMFSCLEQIWVCGSIVNEYGGA